MKKSTVFLQICTLVMCISLVPVSVRAQGSVPPWRLNLDCPRALQIYSGLEYCTERGGSAHVIVIDLEDPGIRFRYVMAIGVDRNGNRGECQDVNRTAKSSRLGCDDPANPDYYPVMDFSEAYERFPDAAVLVDSDYGAGDHNISNGSLDHGPEGFTVVQGNRIDGELLNDLDNNAERRPWLALSDGMPITAILDQFESGEDDGSKPGWIHTAIGGAPWLIDNGVITDTQITNCTNANPHSCESSVAQTAVGLSEDGRWLFLVVAPGRNARGMADFMYSTLRPNQAVKWDGGGSSMLLYGGRPGDGFIAKRVYQGSTRDLSHFLAVFASPGNGIPVGLEPTPEPEPEPEPQDSLWQRFLDWWRGTDLYRSLMAVLEWFQQTRDRIEQSLQGFEEFLQNIQDPEWWVQQATNWLLRCCGFALLPAGLFMSLWVKQRKGRWPSTVG